MKFVRISLFALAASLALPVTAQQSANTEILRQKVKTDRMYLVAQNLQLTEGEAKAFWPVYDAYQGDLPKINQQLAKVIREYADAYNAERITNETAGTLLLESSSIEEAELPLKRAYLPKLEKVMPSAKAVRHLQIENKIRTLVRYELVDGIPLVQ